MRHDLVVSESISINASPEKVWHALVTPSIIKEYLYGTETITDWKIGNDIIFQGEYQGHKYKGIVVENKLHDTISYKYWSGFSGLEDKPENYCLVTYSLQSKDNKTIEFTWTQKGFSNEDGYNHSKNGMSEFLKKIKEVVEKG